MSASTSSGSACITAECSARRRSRVAGLTRDPARLKWRAVSHTAESSRRSWSFALRPVWMLLAQVLVYGTARVALYFAWPADFGELGGAGLGRAMLAGLR